MVYMHMLYASSLLFIICAHFTVSSYFDNRRQTRDSLQIVDHLTNKLVCRKPGTNSNPSKPSRRPFVILGSHRRDGNGFGNKLAYCSAAYYFAAITGRDILIEDNSIYGLACKHIQCGFPFRSEYFPDNYLLAENPPKSFYESEPLVQFLLGSLNITSESNIVLDGFNSGARFYASVDEVHDCARQLSRCEYACIDGYAISQILTGPFKRSPDLDSNFLVGLDYSSELFHTPFQSMVKPPAIDVAIHLRLSFRGFEDSSVESSAYKSEVDEWLASDEYTRLSNALSAKVIEMMSVAKSSNPSRSDKKSYCVYLAADNDVVKNALVRHIQSAVLQSSEVKIPLTMMMTNVSVVHIIHQNSEPHHHDHGTFSTMFDWYVITAADSQLTWSRHEGRGSTFTETSRSVKMISNYSAPNYNLKLAGLAQPRWDQYTYVNPH